jgi:hypothetical protein
MFRVGNHEWDMLSRFWVARRPAARRARLRGRGVVGAVDAGGADLERVRHAAGGTPARQMPTWPRTSALYSCIIIPTGMHGPACIFWADLTPVSPQLSFSATSADLSSAERFPMFMRLPPSDAFQGQAMADLVRLFAAGREFALLKASHPSFYLGALHIKSSRTTCAAAPAGRRSAAQMRAKGE